MASKKIELISGNDLLKLNKEMLKTELAKAVKIANRRLKALEESGMSDESNAYRSAMKKGKFTTKGLSYNQQRSEYVRARNFIESKTSTVTGLKNVMKKRDESVAKILKQSDEIKKLTTKQKRIIKEKNISDYSKSNQSKFWKLKEILQEEFPNEMMYSEVMFASRFSLQTNRWSFDKALQDARKHLSDLQNKKSERLTEALEKYDVKSSKSNKWNNSEFMEVENENNSWEF